MTIEQIRKTLGRKPWKAVEFSLESGDRVVLSHMEDIFFSGDDSRLLLYHEGLEWVTTPEKVTAVKRMRQTAT